MTNQVKRSIAFLAGNFAATGAYAFIILNGILGEQAWNPENRVWWSRVMLGYVGVQILLRILAMIALAAANAIGGETEQVDREDELDKAIDLRSTSITSGIFMVFFLGGILTQAFGLPLSWFLSALTAGLVVSGHCGDLASLIYYRRGY